MKPAGVQQVAREAARGEEDQHEEEGEHPLDRLARAGRERRRAADRAEAHRDQRPEHEDQPRAAQTRVQVGAGDQPDHDVGAGLEHAETRDADQESGDQRDAAQRGQREPVEEAGLDVRRQVRAGIDHREHAALDERHGDRERDVGVGGEAGQARRRLQPARVDGEQDRREEHDREQLEGLAQRLEHRAPREDPDLVVEGHARRRPRPRPPPRRRPRPPGNGRSWPGRRRRASANAGAGLPPPGPRRRAPSRSRRDL